MNKHFAPYHIAKQLKELGFDSPCIGRYRGERFELYTVIKEHDYNGNPISLKDISAPTYDQVIDWFIEKYELFINVNTCRHSGDSKHYQPYLNENCLVELGYTYDDRYSAYNTGILKAIEICKNKI